MRRLEYALLVASLVILIGCGDSSVDRGAATSGGSKLCVEPENPYGDGGGHDAGFKWAEEKGGECSGNSESFNEGCEEYHSQLNRYNQCRAEAR